MLSVYLCFLKVALVEKPTGSFPIKREELRSVRGHVWVPCSVKSLPRSLNNGKTLLFISLQSPPAVQLLHLLNGVGASQALWGGGSGGTLPRGGSVHVVHKKDPPMTVDASLPV